MSLIFGCFPPYFTEILFKFNPSGCNLSWPFEWSTRNIKSNSGKDVLRTSIQSSSWTTMWSYVQYPSLELPYSKVRTKGVDVSGGFKLVPYRTLAAASSLYFLFLRFLFTSFNTLWETECPNPNSRQVNPEIIRPRPSSLGIRGLAPSGKVHDKREKIYCFMMTSS